MAVEPMKTNCPDDVPQRQLVARDKWPRLASTLASVWGPGDVASAKVLVCSGCDEWQVYQHHQLGCLQMDSGKPCTYQSALEGQKLCPLNKWPSEHEKENCNAH